MQNDFNEVLIGWSPDFAMSVSCKTLTCAEPLSSAFKRNGARASRGVTSQSQPCQDEVPAAIQGCPGPLAMEQLHP